MMERQIPNRPNTESRARAFSRREFLGAAGGGALLLAGCGDSVGKPSAGEPTLIVPAGTPGIDVAGFSDPVRWQGQTLKIATFGGDVRKALRSAVLTPFSAATGCTVAEDETDYAMLAESQQRGGAYADVLLVDSVWAAGNEAAYALDVIPSEAVDRARFAPIAATNTMIPAYAYALVSAFRYDAVLRIGNPESWQEWWDTQRFSGARALPRGAFGNFEYALMASGVPPNQLYPLDGAAAIESLKKISGEIIDRWWDSAEQPTAWLSSAKTAFTPAWNFRVVSDPEERLQFDMTWSQGLLLYDAWVMPKGAEHADIASDFIRFATSAEPQASLASTLDLGPVVPDALDQVDAERLTFLPTSDQNLSQLVTLDTTWWAANQVVANERFNSWLLGVPFHE
jgi:putative spermidine/putrescine transport system substrate-binding protein